MASGSPQDPVGILRRTLLGTGRMCRTRPTQLSKSASAAARPDAPECRGFTAAYLRPSPFLCEGDDDFISDGRAADADANARHGDHVLVESKTLGLRAARALRSVVHPPLTNESVLAATGAGGVRGVPGPPLSSRSSPSSRSPSSRLPRRSTSCGLRGSWSCCCSCRSWSPDWPNMRPWPLLAYYGAFGRDSVRGRY